jgi:hypothetical protein
MYVVVPEAAPPGHRLTQIAYAVLTARGLAIDVLVATREEFDSRARARSSLPATVIREGKLLYAA